MASTSRGTLTRHSTELALGALVVGTVGMMIVPLPTWLLDALIATNLSLAILLLLTALFVQRALSFGAFPTLLLVTTLFRLALNVSSTRLILLQADAGEVISAFGDFVVGGNYVVGAVVFLVLTLIQFVVIAKGSERVAEVGARFTLDAMPGKQLAIDSDLRAGTLDVESAAARRRDLERESQFYGAMDGAMKFVKGDAIAAILISGINLLGGLGVGIGMHGLDAVDAVQTYGLLTIGDGLVSQIPALLISTAAGLVVTRVASSDEHASLGRDIAAQTLGDWRALALAAVFCALLAITPGLPAAPFAVLGAALGLGAWLQRRRRRDEPRLTDPIDPPRSAAVELRVGPDLATRLAEQDEAFGEEIRLAAMNLYADLGVRLPSIAPRIDRTVSGDTYVIELAGVVVLTGQSTAADAAADLARRVAEATRARPEDLIGLSEVQAEIDRLAKHAPALVRNVVPARATLTMLSELLRALVTERVSVRPLREILEAIASAPARESSDALLADVRTRIARPLTQQFARDGVLRTRRVDPMIEEAIRDASTADALALDPDLAADILAAVRRFHADDPEAVLLTQPDVRLALRRLVASELPNIAVLSYPELDPTVTVEVLETVTP